MNVVQLQNSHIEHDEVDGVDVSRTHEVSLVQREPQYHGQ